MKRMLMALALAMVAAVGIPSAAQAAEIGLQFQWKSSKSFGGHFHDIVRFSSSGDSISGGSWARMPSADRFNEDRVAIMIEDPQRPIPGFAKWGCYMSCHTDMNNMPAATVDARHYFAPREGELAGAFGSDMWHWRGGRSGPMGYAEDTWVKTDEYGVGSQGRQRDAGVSPTNWLNSSGDRFNADQNWGGAIAWNGVPLPRFVFNPAKTSFNNYFLGQDGEAFTSTANLFALTNPAYRSQLVIFQDYSFDPVDKVNSIDVNYLLYKAGAIAKPDYTGDWEAFWSAQLPHIVTEADAATELDKILAQMKNGVMVTRNVGLIFESSAHDITSRYNIEYGPDGAKWTVTLFRSLSGGADDVDLNQLLKGQLYNMAFAVHDVNRGDNSHHISQTLTLGTNGSDLTAVPVAQVRSADWSAVPATNVGVYQPGQVGLQTLQDPSQHDGAFGLSSGLSCGNCHGASSVNTLDQLSKPFVNVGSTAPLSVAVKAVVTDPTPPAPVLPKGTSLTVRTSATVVSYGGSATLTGVLRTAQGGSLAGKPVLLQASPNGTSGWVTVRTLTSASGTYSTSVKPARGTFYRLRFAGDATHVASNSGSLKVTPKVAITKPSAPKSVKVGAKVRVSGVLKPQHKAGTSPVRIERQRLVKGKWVKYKSVSAKVSNVSGGSKYTTRITLPKKGTWRIRAHYSANSSFAQTKSSWRKLSATK